MPAALSARAVKRKIRSVSNIKKITRAMQMVSAAKLKKVQGRLTELRPYSDKIVEFMTSLSSQIGALNYPLFTPRTEVKKIGVVVFMADKGLCGSYNSNMMRHVQKFLDAKKKPYEAIAVGKVILACGDCEIGVTGNKFLIIGFGQWLDGAGNIGSRL